MGEHGKELAIYIHLPFCVRKCLYCDFISGPYSDEVKRSYVNKLLWEIDSFFDEYRDENIVITSIFFGGGTPSILPPGEIEKILCKLKEHADFIEPEITIEVNPGMGEPSLFEKYHEIGINRISIGLQSTSDEELKTLGRIHTYEQFLNTLDSVKAAGFTNISADIMYAVPGQNYKSFERTLRKVADLGLNHISAYSLIVEEGTPFYEMDLDLPSEEEERRMYRGVSRILSEYGFAQYEISNYAKPGYVCRHNIAYWTGKEYVGFGIAAASLIENLRFTNTKSMDDYLSVSDYEELKELRTDVENLSREDCMSEAVILGLRMNQGVSDKAFYEKFGQHISDVYPKEILKHKLEGLLKEAEDGSISLTAKGRDLSNYVMADFI